MRKTSGPRSWSRAVSAVTIITLLLLSGLWGSVVHLLRDYEAAALDDVAKTLDGMVTMSSERTLHAIDVADQTLLGVKYQWEHRPAGFDLSEYVAHAVPTKSASTYSLFNLFSIVDA